MNLQMLMASGNWSESLRRADEHLAEIVAGAPSYAEAGVRRHRAKARLARGDVSGALDELARMLEVARQARDPQVLIPALATAARIYTELGRAEEARPLAKELLRELKGKSEWRVVDITWVAERLGCSAELRSYLEQLPTPRWRRACLAILDRDFEAAADAFQEIGALEFEAEAQLRAAKKLVAEGRRAEADDQLQRSLAFWRSVGATRCIREGEALLAESA